MRSPNGFHSFFELVAPTDRVLAGVSGGADSVCLLILLYQWRTELNFHLFAGHLNHQLRGSESDEDEAFVRRLCDSLGVELYAERQNVQAILEEEGGTLEEVARRVRYEFFERAARQFNANKVALAHHRDDQVETILFNLLRGSGVHGLRGMPASRPLKPGSDITIVRPLLEVSKSELETLLRERGIAWREDRTNRELPTSRNTIRNRILPILEEFNPSVRDHLLDLGRQARAVEHVLDERAAGILAAARRTQDEIRIEKWRLDTLPEILAGEVVRRMLLELGVGLGKLTARHYRDLAKLTTAMDLPGGWRGRVEHGWLVIGKQRTPVTVDDVVALPLDGTCRFAAMEISAMVEPFDRAAFEQFLRSKDQWTEWLDAERVEGPLQVRYAHEGERFGPLGAGGTKKVGDFLTDIKAGESARPAAVVADDRGILWLIGHRIDDRARITDATKTRIELRVDRQTSSPAMPYPAGG